MPKLPIDGVVISSGRQTLWWNIWCLILPCLAAVAFLLADSTSTPSRWKEISFVLLGLYGLLSLVGLVLISGSMQEHRDVRKMAGGMYYVYWQIADQLWTEECLRRKQTNQSARRWIIPVFILAACLLPAIAVLRRAPEWMREVPVHWYAASGGIVGCIVLIAHWQISGITQHLAETNAPAVIIGPQGIYRTGEFIPGNLREITHAALISEDDPNHLRIIFRAQGNQKSPPHRIPFPPGRRHEALTLVKLLTAE